MKKKSKIKEIIKKFKELWAIPRYRALIKLSLYGIMFLILIIMANKYQDNGTHKNDKNEQNKTYTEIIKTINLENSDILYNIKTEIKEYKIEGKIKDNILSGYLESDDITKILLKDNNIYIINNNIETVDETLNSELISYFLLPKNIINLVENERTYINKEKDLTTYEYNINYNNINYDIKITLNKDTIENINITNASIEYIMEFDFDKIA